MKGSVLILPLVMLIALVAPAVTAVAADAPGPYMRMLDDDGDGIPNCEDPDYSPPLDGTGNQFGKPQAASAPSSGSVRLLWDWRMPFSLCLWVPSLTEVTLSGYGPGDGTGYDGEGPADGTGYGPGPWYEGGN